jgi:tetratricopeptide (TPR) repeat protein
MRLNKQVAIQLMFIIAIIMPAFLLGCSKESDVSVKKTSDKAVFVGDEYKPAFKSAQVNAKNFFDGLEVGEKLIADGKYDEAVAVLKKTFDFASFKGENVMIFTRIADAYEKKGDFSLALETLNQAKQYAKNDVVRTKLDTSIKRIRNLQKTAQ